MEALTCTAKRRGLLLDPRTKLLMLITVTSLMLSTGNSGVMNIVKLVLSVLPFVLLLTEGRWKTAVKYLGLYAICFALERVALYCLSGLPAFLLLAVYWFNPLLWAAYILLGRDMENACDERVLRGLTALCGRAESVVFVSDFIYSDAGRYDPLTEAYRRGLAALLPANPTGGAGGASQDIRLFRDHGPQRAV